MITQTHPRGNEGFYEKSNFKKISQATKQHVRCENGSVLSGKGSYEGGATGGTWSWDPGPPLWVRGSIYKKKVLRDPGPNKHTTATIHKEVLTPPPKRGTQVQGGKGVKIKNHWGIIFGPKMMILQGVRRQKPYIGVCYANHP